MNYSKQFLRTALMGAALTALCVVGVSAADLGVGTVTTDALRMRSAADANASVLATASQGDSVVVKEDAGNGWYKVDFRSVEGYMSSSYLTLSTKADVTIGYGLVQTGGGTLLVRTGPGSDYQHIYTLSEGQVVNITGMDSGWFKISVNGVNGYVSSDYLVTCKDSAGSRGDGTTAAPSSSVGQQLVDYAKQFQGTPYVYGSGGPSSFDCSGFTSYVYAHFGYTLNRTSGGQYSNGSAVSFNNMQPGDLVFFAPGGGGISHVGMYIGGGQFIHASTNQYKVQIDSFGGYYSNVFVGARHVL